MGFYEEGMDLHEMRELLNVLEMSVNDDENSLLECDIQQAIKVSLCEEKNCSQLIN